MFWCGLSETIEEQNFFPDTYQGHSSSHSSFRVGAENNSLSANITKWSNAFKQFVGKLPTNCLSVFDRFVGLALKG